MHADRAIKTDNLFQHEIRFGNYVTAIPEKDLSSLYVYKLETMLYWMKPRLTYPQENTLIYQLFLRIDFG